MKIFCDFDNTIVNTIATITSLYNEDFKFYDEFLPIKWWEVNSWEFKECNCCTREYINTYFNQPRFFDKLTYMDWVKETLEELKNEYEIIIVSMGDTPNLKLKKLWIKENLPYCKFVGVNFKDGNDKSSIDMSEGILLDDSSKNLSTSNALINVCFGDVCSWNEDWNGIRCNNWNDFKKFLKGDKLSN